MRPHDHVKPLADDELLENIGQGCPECFERLFHRYCRQVYSVAYKLLRHKAETEDILQEVFLSIFLQKERYDATRGTVRTWILQFAYFKALLRRRYLNIRNFYRQEEACEGREIRQTSSPELFGMRPAEWARCVETAIMTLSPKQRQVIELVHFDGYTLQEASGIIRETLANTRNHYYRGLKALRDLLNAKDTPKKAQETLRTGGKNAYHLESEPLQK